MKWKEIRQATARGRESEVFNVIAAKPPATARECAEELFQLRHKGWGDETEALKDVAKAFRMTPRSLKRLIKGETKEVSETLSWRIRTAYLAVCQRLITDLENRVNGDLERYGNEASLRDIARSVASLQDKARAAKEALGAGPQ